MAVKNGQRFAEIERLMDDYFGFHLAPVMGKVRDRLAEKRADELRSYQDSAAGILRSLATANMPGDDPYATLRVTGEWNSKTTEDYLAMCKEAIVGNKDLQRDLAVMAEEWRKTAVAEIGRERYDALSERLGCDLAYAYIDHRMEQLMIDKMVKKQMPKSSADYILRKAGQNSLFGLPYELGKSPLAAEIEARGEAAYKPSRTEKAAGWVAGATADVVAMGGAGSWRSLAKYVGVDLLLNAGIDQMQQKNTDMSVSVEQCISQAVFGEKGNVFTRLRREGKAINKHENAYIVQTNRELNKKIPVTNITFMKWGEGNEQADTRTDGMPEWAKMPYTPQKGETAKEREREYVPMVVAPDKAEEYLAEQRERKAREEAEKAAEEARMGLAGADGGESGGTGGSDGASVPSEGDETAVTNADGWDGLMQSVGLNGLSDILKNPGYVLAMLPDILVGLFTGKTKSLNMDNSFLPLASIVAGMFVKNPLLKMLLMGMGGANLLNKAGHEVLERKQQEGVGAPVAGAAVSRAQYRHYPDEPLHPRISNPMLQGRCLVANIDHVPCTIQLPDSVIGAYQSGALPLNTLANAILAKNDQMRQVAAVQYEEQARETMIRPRGIQ